MRCLNIALILSLVCAAPVIAGVRDVNLAIEGNAALSLVRFDGQPREVSVQSSADGVEVTVLGVRAAEARITPPDTHLVNAVDVRPYEDGVRLIYHFNEHPIQGEVEIYAHSVLLRAQFDHSLQAQSASLQFTPSITTKKPAPVHDPAPVTASITPEADDEPAPQHPAYDENAPARDGDVMAPAPVPAPTLGTGLVRDASTVVTEQHLDAHSCAAAQKAIEDDPWALDKLSLYGACIAKEGKTDEAKEIFERLLTFDPDMITAYMGLGAIAQETGDAAAARRHYQQVLGLGGSDAQAAQVRAILGSLGDGH